MIGEWVALPVLSSAGATAGPLDPLAEQVMYPAAERLLQHCDAVLRLPGESKGADQDVAIANSRGIPVYHALEEVPGVKLAAPRGWPSGATPEKQCGQKVSNPSLGSDGARIRVRRHLQPDRRPAGGDRRLAEGMRAGERMMTLLGATGTGKTMTMAATIAEVNRPALVIAHNKTLAAQLCNEFRTFFPRNSVEYFVSYYDYYQPEAYVPSKDLYIEKDSAINQEIDRLRHAATAALFARRDVLIVASV